MTSLHSALSVLNDAMEHGLDSAIKVSPTFALLAGAALTIIKAAHHPNKKCCTSRLMSTNSLLLVYLEGLVWYMESKNPAQLLPEMSRVVDTMIPPALTS